MATEWKDFGIPIIGPLHALPDARIGLDSMHLVLLVFGFFFLGIVMGFVNIVLSDNLEGILTSTENNLRWDTGGVLADQQPPPLSLLPAAVCGKIVVETGAQTPLTKRITPLMYSLIGKPFADKPHFHIWPDNGLANRAAAPDVLRLIVWKMKTGMATLEPTFQVFSRTGDLAR